MLFLPNYDEEDRYYISVIDYMQYGSGEAYTYTLSAYNPLFLSATTGGKVAGLPFGAADILAFARVGNGADKWMLFFDASNMGITRNVNNFAFMPDYDYTTTLALSFQGNQDITDRDGNTWTATPHDVVWFSPDHYGPNTSGGFGWWKIMNGAENVRGKKLDAIARFTYNDLIISTIGGATWWMEDGTELMSRDEDLIASEVEYYEVVNNYWMAFDGSTVPGLAAEDVVAASWKESTGYDYWALVISGSGRVGGQRVNQKDVFLVDADSLEVTPVFHGPDHGFDYLIDGID